MTGGTASRQPALKPGPATADPSVAMTRLDPVATSSIRLGELPRPSAGSGGPGFDAFARVAGADAALDLELGFVRVYAIFTFEPGTNEVRVRVVDETGRLIRTIPPESVAAMIAAMRAYAGR